ncbi:hypothetical protein FB45DRAFT_670999, partial [Roridomyces roridus]
RVVDEMVSWSQQLRRTTLSPLRRMPPELLRHIFGFALPILASEVDGRVTSHSPWTSTHVCSRWRDIAISTPSLW